MRSTLVSSSLRVAALAAALALPAVSVMAPAGASTSTSAAATAVAWPVVGPRTQSPPAQVRTVQYLLAAHGIAVPVSGAYDARTVVGVRVFQRGVGLAATGTVSAPTWRRLIVTCSYGSRGSAVRGVQNQLNYYNLKGTGLLAVDGIFGSLTRQAVLDFQRSHGLTADGIVGPITWRHLVSLSMGG
jgi:peptidoglycan hydrolase-like protein with peptidoglycan-binding domain